MHLRLTPSYAVVLVVASAVACSRAEPQPAPVGRRVEAVATVKATSPNVTCELTGLFHAPHEKPVRVTGTEWRGAASDVRSGDVVALVGTITGTNTWGCELSCRLQATTGEPLSQTSTSPAGTTAPAPTCPPSPSAKFACVLSAP